MEAQGDVEGVVRDKGACVVKVCAVKGRIL